LIEVGFSSIAAVCSENNEETEVESDDEISAGAAVWLIEGDLISVPVCKFTGNGETDVVGIDSEEVGGESVSYFENVFIFVTSCRVVGEFVNVTILLEAWLNI